MAKKSSTGDELFSKLEDWRKKNLDPDPFDDPSKEFVEYAEYREFYLTRLRQAAKGKASRKRGAATSSSEANRNSADQRTYVL